MLVAGVVSGVILPGCTKPPPTFAGREDAEWVAYEITAGETNLRTYCTAFGQKARAYGCSIDPIGDLPYDSRGTVPRPRTSDGVAAHCGQTDITLLVLDDARLAVGCRRPMTVERCAALLAKIAAD